MWGISLPSRGLVYLVALSICLGAHAGVVPGPTSLLNNTGTTDGAREDQEVKLASDGIGNWVAVWKSTYDLGGVAGTDFDIFVSRSSDNGKTWSSPALLNSYASADGASVDDVPLIETDRKGTWVAVWYSNYNLGGTIGTDTDIFYSRSTDNGATWSAAAVLNSTAASDGAASDGASDLTTDGSGNWAVVWHSSHNLGGSIGTDIDVLSARSSDNGATWSAPVVVNTTAGSDGTNPDYDAQIATDANGNWVAVWYSTYNIASSGTDEDIFAARSTDNGASWSAPVLVNSTGTSDTGILDWQQDIATDRDGNWTVTWTSTNTMGGTAGSDQDILVSRSTNNGTTWSTSALLNANATTDGAASDEYPHLTSDGADTLLCTWYANANLGGLTGTDYDIFFSASHDDGATWTTPAPADAAMADGASSDGTPRAATDGRGNWLAVWDSDFNLGGTAGSDRDIFIAALALPTPAALLNSTATSDGSSEDSVPRLATDSLGNWVAVWNSNLNAGGSGTDHDIRTARSTNNGFTWTSAALLNSTATSDTGSVDNHAWIETDGAGTWLATWQSVYNLAGAGTDYDIFFARSTDNGSSWSSTGLLNTTATGDGGSVDSGPIARTDGNGNWVVVWHSEYDLGTGEGADNDILVARSSNNGVTWSAPAFLNSTAATDSNASDTAPRLETDAAGNWVCVWVAENSASGSGGDRDILVARSTNNGATWSTAASLNSTASTDGAAADQNCEVATDGAGDWVVVWESAHNLGGTIGTDMDILVARSTNAGASWSAATVLNTTASVDGAASDDNPQLGADENGNWVCTWASTYNHLGIAGTDYDLLSAISRDGGVSWSAPAIPASTADSDSANDDEATLATDGNGHWVLAWQSVHDFAGTAGVDLDVAHTTFALDVPKVELIVDTLSDTADGTTTSVAALMAARGADGKISLREAITACNNTAGHEVVNFAVSGMISPLTALPLLSTPDGFTIDGTGQSVRIDGSAAAVNLDGMTITGSNHVLRALTFTRWGDKGISIAQSTASQNSVVGCGLGTDGTSDLGNHVGILISQLAHHNTIGGSAPGDRNVIAGNTAEGVAMESGAHNNVVSGNYVGVNAAGNAAIANDHGVAISASPSNVIGPDNVLSGNSNYGMYIQGAASSANTVYGNIVGLDSSGSSAVPNAVGVRLDASAANNTIGSAVAGEGNVVSGNTNAGISLFGTGTNGNVIKGNLVGTDITGNIAIGNSGGVGVDGGALNTVIGGDAAGEANVITASLGNGVSVSGAGTSGTQIMGNSIYDNGGKGILRLGTANQSKAAPVITSVSTTAGTASGTAGANDVVRLFADSSTEGRHYIAKTTATAGGAWSFTGLSLGTYKSKNFTATATNASGSTSEFSAAFATAISPTSSLALNSTAAVDGASYDEYVDVVTDGQGRWLAVWNSNYNLGGTIGTDSDIFYARSSDNGATWGNAQVLNSTAATDGSGNDAHGHVAVGANGNWVTVWASNANVFGSGSDYDIFVSRSTDHGATWSAAALLNNTATSDTATDMQAEIATDGAGNWVCVWPSDLNLSGSGTDFDLLVARSTDNVASWTTPVSLNSFATTDGPINGTTGADMLPEITTDGEGTWVCIWISGAELDGDTSGDDDVYWARSTDNGATWSTAAIMNSSWAALDGFLYDTRPHIGADGAGGWVAVWDTVYNADGDGVMDGDIAVSYSRDGAQSWSTPALLNTSALDSTSEDYTPIVRADTQGNWVCVWQSQLSLGGGDGADIDLFIAHSTDGGASWTAPAYLNHYAGIDGAKPEYNQYLVNDGLGHWVAAWHSTYDMGGAIGTDGDILYTTFNLDTTAPNVVAITPNTPGPTNANTLAFTVAFDEAVQNFNNSSDVIVLNTGPTYSGVGVTGGPQAYTVIISGIAGDGTLALAVNLGSDVQDVSGNALAGGITSAAVVIDNTAPTFTAVAANPPSAAAGDEVEITFSTPDVILGDPFVTVNGNVATMGSKAASYTFFYTVQETDPLGQASIEISGLDEAGNPGGLTNTNALFIREVGQDLPLSAWPIVVMLGMAGAMTLGRKRKEH